MDCDLNKLSTEELRSYGDILYLRLAKAEGATEVVGFLREHFKGRKVWQPFRWQNFENMQLNYSGF